MTPYHFFPKKSGTGFSLIEATVAIAIIGTMIVATGALLERIPVSGREAKDQDLALRIARNELEALRAAGYAGLPESGAFTDPLLASLSAGAATRTVTDFSESTKRVDVLVAWEGTGVVPRSVSLTTLITKSGATP